MSAQPLNVSHLNIVPVQADSPAQRAQSLYAQAQEAALEQVVELESALEKVVALSRSISEGGEIYPSGIRELCRRAADDAFARSQTLHALAGRSRG